MEQTYYLNQLISHCDDLEAFKEEVFPIVSDAKIRWKEKINQILMENGYSKSELARLCQVSRPAVAKWCNGSLPSSRDDYIKIGFAAHYSYAEMNFFLQRYGRYPGLYAKSLEDSVYIFVLNASHLEHSYALCTEILSELRSSITSAPAEAPRSYDTDVIYNGLLQVETLGELQDFVRLNAAIYQDAYSKFYAYVNAFIAANNCDVVSRQMLSVNSLAEAQNWSSSLRQCVSAIRQKSWFPLRRKVIVLGLHLNMTVSQINEMLRYAQMEPLCAKNPVEGAIMFAVNDAELNDMICQDGGTELCDYVKQVLEYLNIQGIDLMLQDL